MANSHAMVFCEICNIGVSSELSMRDHVKGRRHQQAVGAVERRKALARNSLYCHGFPPTTPTAALQNYFQRFGAVTRIVVETQKYDSEVPVRKALSQRNHQLYGCLLTVRPRKPINTYRRPSEADRNLRKVQAAQEEEEVEASHEQLMKSLLQADSVLGQMELLYESLRLSDAELERRRMLCDYLHSVLVPFLPTCTIHQFGSSVNRFGMRGCDMDIFVDLHDHETSLQWEESLRHRLKPVTLPHIREIQSLKTTEGPLMPSQLRPLSLVHRVKLMSRILMQHGQQCANIQFVPSVRCPIVRFVHSPTGIKCDLSINNRLALQNTRLLKMCAEDRRVPLLVFAVRYWGKWKQVAGNQNCGPRLSNYCLSLLVLFYLSNTSPPILPSVQSLADLAGPDKRCIVEDWDCSLPEAVPPTLNTQSADELLEGFFQFYNEVSLTSSVILTRPGTVMPLNDFLMEKINTAHLNDFKVKAMAVQDPFVLCHNIAQNMNNGVRDLLVQEICMAASKTSSWSSAKADSCAESSQSGSAKSSRTLWGLPYLYSAEGSKSTAHKSTDPSSTSGSSSWCEVTGDHAKRSFHSTCQLSLNLSVLSQKTLAVLQAKGDYRTAWFQRVRKLFLWALRDVFLFTVKTDKDGGLLLDGDVPQEDVEEMCTESTCSSGSPERNKMCGAESCVQQVGATDTDCPALNSSPGHSGAGLREGMGQDLNCNTTQSSTADTWASEHGGEKSPQCQSSFSLPSPMAVSELASPSPDPAESKKLLCVDMSDTSGHPQLNSPASPSVPCSPVSHLSGSEHTGQNALQSCDVEMISDPSSSTAHPSLGQVDSPAAQNNSKDIPHKCSMGEAALGTTSAVPVRVECSPIGDGEVLIASKDGELDSSELQASATEGAGPSLQKEMLSLESRKFADHVSHDPSAAQNSAKGSTATTSKEAAAGCSAQQKDKKCRPLGIFCEGQCRAWYGRKVVRANLLAEGHSDDLELEKVISKTLATRDADSNLPVLQFHCTLSPVPKLNCAEAEIGFDPVTPVPKEFSVFTTFFRSFFTKLVSKNLLESATV